MVEILPSCFLKGRRTTIGWVSRISSQVMD
jgi:hypothetical protein